MILIFNVIVGERTEILLEIGRVTVMYRGKDLGKMRHNRRMVGTMGQDHGGTSALCTGFGTRRTVPSLKPWTSWLSLQWLDNH